jgi:transcriptional regulator with XRE-family HTH domain
MDAKPPLRRRRLGAIMRAHRETAGMNLDEAEEASEVGKSAISRLENATTKIKPLYVRTLAKTYGLEPSEVESLVDLAKQCERRGWWSKQEATLSAEHIEYIAFENDASLVRNYESLVVPGLLQTEDYARAVARDTVRPLLPEKEIENRAKIRVKRQERVDSDDPLDLWAVVDESVLRRPTGGITVMAKQLERLDVLSRRPNITVQVIPNDIGAHPGMSGAFHILSFSDPRVGEVVYVDTPVGEVYAEEEDQIRACESIFDHLKASALSEQKSRSLIRQIAKELPET